MIESAEVDSILFRYRSPSFALQDRRHIERIVDEINGLSFTPASLPFKARARPHIVLKNRSGDAIVEVDFGNGWVGFREPQSAWFYVKRDSAMEIIGRVEGYANYLADMDSLKSYAERVVWDGTDRGMVALDWEKWVTEFYPEPYSAWPVPDTPQELSERLKSLPILTLDELDRFPDYFD